VASITREANGRRLIQFVAGDGKRKSIRLGKVSQRIAEEIRVKVEQLNTALIARCSVDNETARWVNELGDALAHKLNSVGLIAERGTTKLADFMGTYIRRRTDAKPSTLRNLEAAKSRLVEFFGRDRNIRDVSPGDGDEFALWLRERYSNGTAGRTVRRAKQFFRAAVRRKIIEENPFGDVKAPSEANESRKFFVTKENAQKALDACPDLEWRLIFALSRFGGLRCPSEHLALKWPDVDWAQNRFWVPSPKTEHHEGHEGRWVPIFAELRLHLEKAFDSAKPGAVFVIERYRDAGVNLRTHLLRIIKRAGLEPWPKLFHNLRASRETELAEQYPIHVVCKWLGHAAGIAQKHYLQVREEYFQQAAMGDAESGAQTVQNAVQQPAARSRTDSQISTEVETESDFVLIGAEACKTVQNEGMPLIGLEPITR